ncbi:antibiotic biosynthesis monooxygenase family protein [Spirillospora sp. NPDC049652]
MPNDARVFRVVLRMSIRPGMEEEFERTWREVGDAVTSDPANIRQSLSRSDEEDGVYYVVSDWVDEPGFRRFEHSEEHVGHRTKLHPYRSSGAMLTMRVVAEMTGAALAPTRP